MMYIINKTMDYADEFYYTIRSIFPEKYRTFVLENSEELAIIYDAYSDYSVKFNFGTNDGFELTFDDIIDMIEDSKPVSDEDVSILEKYRCAYLDVFDLFMDRLVDAVDEAININDNFDVSDKIRKFFVAL